MAVVGPSPFHPTLDFWGHNRATSLSFDSPELATLIMSYQYPPPPPNGDEMGIPPPGYITDYSSIQPPPSGLDMRPAEDSGLDPRDRRDSSSNAMKQLKRSVSTPNVKQPMGHLPPQSRPPPILEQPQLALAGDKRRNKLGYHRTSVACGHCRRRKIRCLLSPSDVQGRCVNCIRLKKECSFFPVDQQPPVDTRKNSASRIPVGPKLASASGPSNPQTGLPGDSHSQTQQYSQLNMPTAQGMAPPALKPTVNEPFSAEAKLPSAASSSRNLEYGHQGINWMAADAGPPSSKAGEFATPWRSSSYPQESPITPAFSPFTPHAPPPSAAWAGPGEPSSREDLGWSYPPPPRSMSFAQGDTMSSPHHHQQPQYPSPSQGMGPTGRPLDRKAGSMTAEMYPAPMATGIAGAEHIPGTTMEQHVSLSAGALPPTGYAAWQQQQPYQQYGKPGEGYGGWYGEGSSGQPLGPDQGPHDTPNPGPGIYYPPR